MANHQRKNNYVESMEIDCRVVMGNEQLRNETSGYFYRLYKEEVSWRPNIDGIDFRALNEFSRIELERVFLEDL